MKDYREYVVTLIKDYHFEEFLSQSKSCVDWFYGYNLESLGFNCFNGACRYVLFHNDWDFVLKFTYDSEDNVDYCANEQFLYYKATEWGVEKAFAWCDYVGKFGAYDLYAMERCICNEDAMNEDSYRFQFEKFCEAVGYDPEDEEAADEFNFDCDVCVEDQECMLELAFEHWSMEFAVRIQAFFDAYHINDCHCGNWGWRQGNNEMVVVDYAGYGDEASYIANKRKEEWQ